MTAGTWAAWVVLVMGLALTRTNPFYLAVTLLVTVLVAVLAPVRPGSGGGLKLMLLTGVSLGLLSMAVAIVNGGAGSHVIIELPTLDAPDWLGGLRLGGPVTAESLVGAGIRTLVLLTVLIGFAAFSGAVSPHQVVRLAPATLFHASLVVTIGLTLLPSTLEDLRRIREMQALRGHSTGLRSLPGVFVPALLAGLDRSMRLAEAMEARGFVATGQQPRATRLIGIASAPLLLAAAWLWFYYPDQRWLAAPLALAGIAAIAAWGWSAARQRRTTRLHDEVASPLALIASRISLAVAPALVFSDLAGWLPTDYTPFAGLPWPPFTPWGALLAALPLWPAVVLLTQHSPARGVDFAAREVHP
jgi:energy-coupling factor transport system permease protein